MGTAKARSVAPIVVLSGPSQSAESPATNDGTKTNLKQNPDDSVHDLNQHVYIYSKTLPVGTAHLYRPSQDCIGICRESDKVIIEGLI